MNKKFLIVTILFVFTMFISLLVLKYRIFEYVYHRLLLANNPTTLFSCDHFDSEPNLLEILNDSNNSKVKQLKKYLQKNNGDISIKEVGSRCPNKFQYYVEFGGDSERIEIEKILDDQTINGIPVFLHNR